MKHCDHCNILIESESMQCPLCGRKLVGKDEPHCYPPYEKLAGTEYKKRSKIGLMAVVTAAILGACALVNILSRDVNGGYWFMDIAVILAYLWVLVLHTVKSHVRGSIKLFVQAVMISLMLLVFDLNAGQGMWSVRMGIPIVSSAMICIATFIVGTRKLNWNDYIAYGVVVLLIGLAPLTAVELGVAQMAWPFWFCASYGVVTFIFMMTRADRKYKESAKRRFRF
ncbi:MAG: DUF6320 domain-containing protein [Christensenella sp.]|nr:DUF6320 domain-containing protein [Christensenella sp.]